MALAGTPRPRARAGRPLLLCGAWALSISCKKLEAAVPPARAGVVARGLLWSAGLRRLQRWGLPCLRCARVGALRCDAMPVFLFNPVGLRFWPSRRAQRTRGASDVNSRAERADGVAFSARTGMHLCATSSGVFFTQLCVRFSLKCVVMGIRRAVWLSMAADMAARERHW